MKFIVDRFEDDYAVCEDDKFQIYNIPRTNLPIETKEGDVIIYDGCNYLIDTLSTTQRSSEVDSLMKELFE